MSSPFNNCKLHNFAPRVVHKCQNEGKSYLTQPSCLGLYSWEREMPHLHPMLVSEITFLGGVLHGFCMSAIGKHTSQSWRSWRCDNGSYPSLVTQLPLWHAQQAYPYALLHANTHTHTHVLTHTHTYTHTHTHTHTCEFPSKVYKSVQWVSKYSKKCCLQSLCCGTVLL